jgi:hypothetical protein
LEARGNARGYGHPTIYPPFTGGINEIVSPGLTR